MCSYDCSVHPTDINEDNDITGIGVLIGYCATAGIAVFIIVFHYLFSYEPRLDPFRERQANPLLCIRPRPNPIDEIVLRGPRELFFKAFGITNSGRQNHARFEKSLVKCILSMSDVQIITGISIIVSGAAQLKCGISTHQWQVLVYLAWFSSLTHLSCLTLLRNYLHQRPAERIWRLFCIFIWGVQRLFSTVRLCPNKEDMEWSFGQVMSIALLAVPLVTVFEFFYPESKTQKVEERQGQMCSVSVDRSEVISEISAYSELALPFSQDLVRRIFNDHPDYEFYYESCSLVAPAVTLVLSVVSLSLWCLIRACTFNGLEGLGFLQISFYPWGLTPLVLTFCIFYGILFSFLIASIRSNKRRKGEGHSLLVRSLPVIVIICLTGAAFVMFAFGVSGPYSGWAALGVAGLYFLCSLFASAGDWHTRVHLAEV
ncbi:hypothetical protein MYU51_019519 [Penicillium brevicompactum]